MPKRENLETASTEVPAYTLGAGDHIRIIVYGHDDLSGSFMVDGAGMVSLPLIQRVRADHLSLPEFETAVAEALARNHIIDPKVSVELVDTRPFCVVGEVRNPGCYDYKFGMTAYEAIATAGGYTYRALENEFVITRGAGKRLAADEDTPVNVGDVIEVDERLF